MTPSHREDSLHRRMQGLALEMCGRGILLPQAMREFEHHYLRTILRDCGGNRSRAARVLGIHRNTLRNKLQAHGL